MLALLAFLFISTQAASTPSCLDLSNDYCKNLYSPPRLGNWGEIKLGNTTNDIKYSKYYFLNAVLKSIPKQAKDIQKAFKKNDVAANIQKYIKRKDPQWIKPDDVYNLEWTSDNIDLLKQAFFQVANARTGKLYPEFLIKPAKDTSPFWNTAYYRELDKAWAEFFTQVWKDDPAWKKVQDEFEIVRAEYLLWNEADTSLSPEFRKYRREKLLTLKLGIPGAISDRNYETALRCGVDEDNAYYNSFRHSLTVCVGGFVGNEPLLTIAHEVGHSISNNRRVIDYIAGTDFGKSYEKLWFDQQKGTHLTCEQWRTFKDSLQKNVAELPPYHYEDEKFLETFVTKDLREVYAEIPMRSLTARLAKKSADDEIRENTISQIIKKNEILQSGRSIKNEAYLNPEALFRWSLLFPSLIAPTAHFTTFFTEEYNCLLNEKKIPDTKALENAIVEAKILAGLSWKMILTVGGKFSSFTNAIEEEFAQDIEEDVVDSYASHIVARILKKTESVDKRRADYFKATASFCDPISFRQLYPDETNVLYKFTNSLHSIGQDRRNKLLTEDIKPLLQCK